jgi:hypothetical protein
MRYRHLVWMIGFFLVLDLTNPFIGSAFNFNVEESVDCVSRQHERLPQQIGSVTLPVPLTADVVRAAPIRPRVRARADWFVQLRRAHPPLSDLQSPTEDH